MDSEKVIEAFDEAKELVWTDDDEYTVGYNNGIEAGKDIALSLLKEQEAVEPKVEKAILDYQSWHYICGDCGGQIDIHDNYCRHCGTVLNDDDVKNDYRKYTV